MKKVTMKSVFAKIFALFFISVSVFNFLPEYVHAQAGGVAADAAGQAAGAAAACGIQALLTGGAPAAAGAGAAAGGTAVTAGSVASGFPVNSVAANALLTANLTSNTVIAANTTVKNVKDDLKCGLDAIAWSVAKVAVLSITRSTVNWINSGFNGSPAFVSDLKSNLKYLGDAVADDFFNQLNKTVINTTGFNIKSPFQDQIAQKLRTEYYRQTSGALGFSAYDLSGHSTDPKAFIDGQFSQGGFNAFFSASQNPANNPFGAYKLASDQLWASIDAAAQQRKSELDWGKGFLPWRGACTPAAKAPLLSDATLADLERGAAAESGTPVSLSKTEQCTGNAVRTPGSVIESQLEKNLGSGVEQLNLADSINEIVGALMGQLVNQVLGSGGLLGTSQPSSGGGSSYLNQATDPSQYNKVTSSVADGVIQNLENDRTSLNNFQLQWGTILAAANKAQTSCGVRPEITTVLTQGNQALAKASSALSALNIQEDSIKAAINSKSGNSSQTVSNATASYQSYLSKPGISATEFGEAAIQSQESTSDSSPSLYTQMTTLAASCSVR